MNTQRRTQLLTTGAVLALAAGTISAHAEERASTSPGPVWGATTMRASVGAVAAEADSSSLRSPAISGRGRYVAFTSAASNLVPGDMNGAVDVFVRDRLAATTIRVSVATDGTEANEGGASSPAISTDGGLVAFEADAANLVEGDTNGEVDVFVRDVRGGMTRQVSVAANGGPSNGSSWGATISGNGRYVAFVSSSDNLIEGDTNDLDDVFVRDLWQNVTRRVSVGADGTQADGHSSAPALSKNGQTVAFATTADNLVAGAGNPDLDIVVKDLVTGQTTLASVAVDGAGSDGMSQGPALSADGCVVAFTSSASNLVADDTNNQLDVFVRNLAAASTTRVSIGTNGVEANASSSDPTLSATGRLVAFTSHATNLVTHDTNGAPDVFVRDLRAGTTQIASVTHAGMVGEGGSTEPAMSPTSEHLAFLSQAGNLVEGDTNGSADVMVRDAFGDG